MEHKVIGVIFEISRRKYYFEVLDDTEYNIDDKVIVKTIRGDELGLIYVIPKMIKEEELVLPLKPVIRKATKEDIEKYEILSQEAQKALDICKKKVIEHKLPMVLIASEYTFDKSKLMFYFTADGRVDFRTLVKDLAAIFKLRIELRQIGVRDEARIIGSLGICGLDLCCRSFINKFDSVSIKMARDQGLVINPSKISGACGRLLCCIKYEHQQYEEALEKFPAFSQSVETPIGSGRIISLKPLSGEVIVDVEGKGVNSFKLDEIKFDMQEAKNMRQMLAENIDEELKELEGDQEKIVVEE